MTKVPILMHHSSLVCGRRLLRSLAALLPNHPRKCLHRRCQQWRRGRRHCSRHTLAFRYQDAGRCVRMPHQAIGCGRAAMGAALGIITDASATFTKRMAAARHFVIDDSSMHFVVISLD
jgi:hypothetical protein